MIEVFREYIEKGRLYKASKIIVTQVTNLESATQRIEIKAKALTKEPTPQAKTYASIVTTGLQPSIKIRANP